MGWQGEGKHRIPHCEPQYKCNLISRGRQKKQKKTKSFCRMSLMIRFSPYVYIISGCPTVLSYLGVALMRRLNACPPKTNGAMWKNWHFRVMLLEISWFCSLVSLGTHGKIHPITIVCDTYIIQCIFCVNGVLKPTNIIGGGHIVENLDISKLPFCFSSSVLMGAWISRPFGFGTASNKNPAETKALKYLAWCFWSCKIVIFHDMSLYKWYHPN